MSIATALTIKEIFKDIILVVSKTKSYLSDKLNTFEIGDALDIAESFYKGQTDYGNFVKGIGFFSEYAHTYKPYTYVPINLGQGREKVTYSIINNKLIPRYEASVFVGEPFPLPIETLPNLLLDKQLIRLGFMYSSNFSSFIYPMKIENKIRTFDEKLDIKDTSKHIPILFPVEYSKFLNRIVNFKAKIVEIPTIYFEKITANLGELSNKIFNLAYNPYEINRKTLCLSLLDDNSDISQSVELSLSTLPSTFFLEAHLENFTFSSNAIDLFYDAVPNTIKNSYMGSDYKSNTPRIIFPDHPNYTGTYPIVTTNEIRVVFKEPNILGLYIETDIKNSGKYSTDIQLMKDFYFKLSRNIQKVFTTNSSSRVKIKLDFLSDYRLGTLFDPRGLLQSEEVNLIVDKQPSLINTVKWLRNEQ